MCYCVGDASRVRCLSRSPWIRRERKIPRRQLPSEQHSGTEYKMGGQNSNTGGLGCISEKACQNANKRPLTESRSSIRLPAGSPAGSPSLLAVHSSCDFEFEKRSQISNSLLCPFWSEKGKLSSISRLVSRADARKAMLGP